MIPRNDDPASLRTSEDGKEHLYCRVVEMRRSPDWRTVQRDVVSLGKLNGVQKSTRRETVELFGQDDDVPGWVAG